MVYIKLIELGKSASTPIDAEKPLLKDLDGEDVDGHTYRSMIGSLMYLTSSRPDLMFAVCACVRFQVTLKISHLNTVKRIFRYLKGKPYLGLWYPKDSPFNLVAYSDSDYAGASLDRKSITGGCQFLGCRLISWQCKKQTVVATSLTEAEYVAAASGYAQVLWMQNQLLYYGVLVTKPHNKTPYELLHGRLPSIGFMRPFGYPVTILNTMDPLGKFQGNVDEGFLVGYSVCSSGLAWLFDIDSLTRTMNYHPVIAENQTNSHAGFQDTKKQGRKELTHMCFFPVLSDGSTNSQNNKKDALVDGKEHDDDIQKSVSPDIHSSSSGAETRKLGDKTENKDKGKSHVVTIIGFRDLNAEFKECNNNSSNGVNAASSSVSTARQNSINSTNNFSAAGPLNAAMPNLEDLSHSNVADDVGAEADINNLESIISVSPIPTTKIHKDNPTSQIIGDLSLTTQTISMARTEPKRVHQALKDPSWIKAMQEELLQFKMQKVWILVYLPYGKRAISTKWVYRNKKEERGIVIRNKARLVTQGHTQEEGIDYKEVFAPVARIEAIRLFLAYASFMGFPVYQMDVKSAFLYGTIEEEVYVCQRLGFEDPKNPDKVCKVVKALYGLHQAPRAWYETLATYLLENRFQRGTIDQTLFIKKQQKDILLVKQKKDGIFISQDKYVADILKKFRLSEGKSASTPIDAEKPLLKDSDGVNTPRSDEDRLKLMELMVFLLEMDSDAAEGFEQIIDFLSGSYFYYALTVNPYICILSIKQFWNTASVKRSGDVTKLQALVDKKKIMISEVVICKILQLDDAEGVVCFPNEEIFVGLTHMGYEKPSTKLTFYKAFFSSHWKFLIHTILKSLSAKRTSWNEFSTTMASAVICLSKGQKFNFLKYIFDSLVHNVDSSSKFYMVGKGFSWVETPLFEGMLADRPPAEEGLVDEQVQVADAVEENVAEDVSHDAIPSPPSHDIPSLSQEPSSPNQQPQIIIKLKARVKRLEKTNKVKSSKLRCLRKVGASKQVESSDAMEDIFNQEWMIDDMDKDKEIMIDDMDKDEEIEFVKDADIAETEGRHAAQQAKKQAEIYHIDLDHSSKVLSMQEDDSEVQEVVEPSIPVAALIVIAAYTRRRNGVIIRDPEEELSSKTLAETLKVKDKGKGILVRTPKPMKKKDQTELDEEYTRKLHKEINRDHDEFNKDIDWDAAMDHVNQKSNNPQYIKRYQGIKKRPQTESEARKNMMIYLKNTAGYKMDFFKGMTEEMEEEDQEIIKSINETSAQKAAKRRKLSEETEDLRKRLEVVDDEDDDVFIEATPLARKVPVVDYRIVLVDNKPKDHQSR
nr:hypothetical protein [Tanacetum cinerariifolium]